MPSLGAMGRCDHPKCGMVPYLELWIAQAAHAPGARACCWRVYLENPVFFAASPAAGNGGGFWPGNVAPTPQTSRATICSLSPQSE